MAGLVLAPTQGGNRSVIVHIEGSHCKLINMTQQPPEQQAHLYRTERERKRQTDGERQKDSVVYKKHEEKQQQRNERIYLEV